MCLFSVIMPVYNASVYLDAAVNSILHQTYRDFELIIVDDGSIDGSAEKCDIFAEQDSRVKVTHIKNAGISYARNVGMKMAKGEYIAFCDHDDEYVDVLMEKLDQYINTYNHPNVLKYTAKQIKVWGKNSVSINRLPEKIVKINEIVKDYNLLIKFEKYVWDGIYKKDFIENNMLYFEETMVKGGEDYFFNMALFEKADKIISIKECLYTHFYRVGQSTSTKFDVLNVHVYLKNAEREYALIEKFNYRKKTFPCVLIMHKARYAVAVASECIYRTGCNLNKKKILDRIESVRSTTAYKHRDSLRGWLHLFRKNFKWGILYSAFSLKQTWLMYFIMRCNQRLRYKN